MDPKHPGQDAAEAAGPHKVPALYFDKDGLGPDHVYLELFSVRGDDVMETSLSLRVRAGEFVMRAQIDGGYLMGRQQVEQLRDALTQWLTSTKAVRP